MTCRERATGSRDWGGVGGGIVVLMWLVAAVGVHGDKAQGGLLVMLGQGFGFLLFWVLWARGRRGPETSRNCLRDLRKQRALSQAELAEAIEVSRQTINAVEADKYDPSLPMAYKLAAFFEVPVEQLFYDPFRELR